MSPSQSQREVQHGQDESAPEPQQPRISAPSHYQAVSFLATMPNAFTSAYDTMEEPGLVTSVNSPYAVPYAYSSPVMQYPGFQAQTASGIHAGAHAEQASHPQMPLHCQPTVDPSQQQVQHNVFSPNQSMPGMTATGFEPNSHNNNFMDHNHFIAPPMVPFASAQANFANGHGTSTNLYPEGPQPNDTEPSANTNGWTEAQDNLVRRLKHEKKKVTHKQISKALKREFGVERSGNAISKRWKIIKKRDSEEASKAVIQNVLSQSKLLQRLQNALSEAVPGYKKAQQDSQMALLVKEIQGHFQNALVRAVEGSVLRAQRMVRHGGVNL